MCTVSMISDGWREAFPDRYPWWEEPNQPKPYTPYYTPSFVHITPDIQPYKTDPYQPTYISAPPPSIEDFNKLKAEMEELKKLIKAAQKFDVATDQAECEQEEKIAFIRKVAESVGVDVDDVFGKEKNE